MPEDEITRIKLIKDLQDFFRYFLTKRYLNENHDPSIPDLAYEGKVSLTGADKRGLNLENDESGENNINDGS